MVIPSNTNSSTFVTVCWDNSDITEEILSGLGTMHCTNGIVVQRQVSTALPKPKLPDHDEVWRTCRRQQHSLPVPEFEHIEYNAGQRRGPLPLSLSYEMFALGHASAGSLYDVEFAWVLSRLLKTDSAALGQEMQRTPGWAGFNALLQSEAIIGIPASPTEMSTVYLLLQWSRPLLIGSARVQFQLCLTKRSMQKWRK